MAWLYQGADDLQLLECKQHCSCFPLAQFWLAFPPFLPPFFLSESIFVSCICFVCIHYNSNSVVVCTFWGFAQLWLASFPKAIIAYKPLFMYYGQQLALVALASRQLMLTLLNDSIIMVQVALFYIEHAKHKHDILYPVFVTQQYCGIVQRGYKCNQVDPNWSIWLHAYTQT